jgi:hypothetical protein
MGIVDCARETYSAFEMPIGAFGHLVAAADFRSDDFLLTSNDQHAIDDLYVEVVRFQAGYFESDLNLVIGYCNLCRE